MPTDTRHRDAGDKPLRGARERQHICPELCLKLSRANSLSLASSLLALHCQTLLFLTTTSSKCPISFCFLPAPGTLSLNVSQASQHPAPSATPGMGSRSTQQSRASESWPFASNQQSEAAREREHASARHITFSHIVVVSEKAVVNFPCVCVLAHLQQDYSACLSAVD